MKGAVLYEVNEPLKIEEFEVAPNRSRYDKGRIESGRCLSLGLSCH